MIRLKTSGTKAASEGTDEPSFHGAHTVSRETDFVPPPYETPHVWRQLEEVLERVSNVVAPVWPLADYVAVNPLQGVSDRRFLDARTFLKVFSDCEILMPIDYFALQFRKGEFGTAEIEAAIDEMRSVGIDSQWSLDTIVQKLQSAGGDVEQETGSATASRRQVRTIAEYIDRFAEINWTETIQDEIGKFCSAHYDDGQALWKSPWRDLPLYQAWRSAAMHDFNVEALGLTGFRQFVSQLPHTPEEAIVELLSRLEVPPALWETVLLCEAFSVMGWSAFARFKDGEVEDADDGNFVAMLAIRLAYDAGLSQTFDFSVRWNDVSRQSGQSFRAPVAVDHEEAVMRLVLLRANEIGFRDNLIQSLNLSSADVASGATSTSHDSVKASRQKLAQLVFCIDVRSERMRRQLETVSPDIETFGFAGFFGMPIEYVPMGAETGSHQVPVLLQPQFQLHEGLHHHGTPEESEAIIRRDRIRGWRNLWKGFQSSAVGCFTFVETTGMLCGPKLLLRTLGIGGDESKAKYDGLCIHKHARLGPTLRGLSHQGLTVSRQADLVESMLRGIGLTKDFARLVVFCGHASQTSNNPLASGLDCGACGGHSGEPNARLAAMLLNQPYIRNALAERGIEIPSETHFVGAVHNTTTDRLDLFDLADVPPSRRQDVQQLVDHASIAGDQTRRERMPVVGSSTVGDLMRRASDWSEVRPEWGLAGNAAFIVGPRHLTRNAELDGRSFLHSYDHTHDTEGSVLESIMTAPMVVAHLINMQYYASSVDNHHFGSGSKTIHNVVGRFGILSGNGGDLRTGLAWQSLHDGDEFQHQPLRLQVLIAAPRDSIDLVIARHELVANLLTNGWLHLMSIDDDGAIYEYTESGAWECIRESESCELAGA